MQFLVRAEVDFFFLIFFHVFPRDERSLGNKIQRLLMTYVLPGVGLECALILLVLLSDVGMKAALDGFTQ